MTDGLNIDQEKVRQRITFLVWRGEAHANAALLVAEDDTSLPYSSDIYQRLAATCFRDAGMLALAIDDQEGARRYLRAAGRHAISGGMLSGYFLLELSREQEDEPWWLSRGNELHDVEERVRRVGSGRQSADIGALPEQLQPTFTEILHLYQSLLLTEDEQTRNLEHSLRQLLSRREGAAVGASSIPLSTYMTVLDGLKNPRKSLDAQPPAFNAQRAFETILLRERERLALAQANRYQWENLLVPIELLDLNVVFLAALADGTPMFRKVRARLAKECDQLTLLPLDRASAIFHSRPAKRRRKRTKG